MNLLLRLDNQVARLVNQLALCRGNQSAWLKYLAVVAMVCDHLNQTLLAYHYPAMSAFGRLAMPIFVVILGANLTETEARDANIALRAASRLLIAAIIAQPFYGHLFHTSIGNVMFTLALGVLLPQLRLLRFGLILLLGFYVDYYWFGLLLVSEGLQMFRAAKSGKPCAHLFAIWLSAFIGICVINNNAWALLAIPLMLIADRLPIRLPRLKWAFYAFYPAHLAIMLGISIWRV